MILIRRDKYHLEICKNISNPCIKSWQKFAKVKTIRQVCCSGARRPYAKKPTTSVFANNTKYKDNSTWVWYDIIKTRLLNPVNIVMDIVAYTFKIVLEYTLVQDLLNNTLVLSV
jgi:hypothetical protein